MAVKGGHMLELGDDGRRRGRGRMRTRCRRGETVVVVVIVQILLAQEVVGTLVFVRRAIEAMTMKGLTDVTG